MKTVFIPLTRGLLVRNLLRNKFFRELCKRDNTRVVLLFSVVTNKTVAQYIRDEFEADNVIIEFVPNVSVGRFRKLFFEITRNLVFSPTTKMYAKYGTAKVAKKTTVTNVFLSFVYTPLSKIKNIKKIVRWIETYVFLDQDYGHYFDKYKPDLVFSTAILSNFDLAFLKHARRRGVKTVSMPKSWDNLDKILFRFEPDYFAVQNTWMLQDAKRYQGFSLKDVRVVGFPQFDIYRDKDAIESRESYCSRHGFDPILPIIFIGSEGLWSPGDEVIFEKIIDARDSHSIPDCNIIIRPHFSTIQSHPYNYLRKRQRVFIDDTYRKSDFFADNWDPTEEDMKDFANTLRHANVSINFASTLSLDAVCFDLPIINISFGVRMVKQGSTVIDLTPVIYKTGFYKEVLETNATILVNTYDEVFAAINMYLENRQIKQSERAALLNKLCYLVDGKSGGRLYDLVDSLLS